MAGTLGQQEDILLGARPLAVEKDDAAAAPEVDLALVVLGGILLIVDPVAGAKDSVGLVGPAPSLVCVSLPWCCWVWILVFLQVPERPCWWFGVRVELVGKGLSVVLGVL